MADSINSSVSLRFRWLLRINIFSSQLTRSILHQMNLGSNHIPNSQGKQMGFLNVFQLYIAMPIKKANTMLKPMCCKPSTGFLSRSVL